MLIKVLALALLMVTCGVCIERVVRGSEVYRVFGCPPCDLSKCYTPSDCELVKEPGICGCCLTCARRDGELCGVYTERCGDGLQCVPRHGASKPLLSLLKGQGTCRPLGMYIFL